MQKSHLSFLRGGAAELKQLIRDAVSQGWSASRTSGGHIKLSKDRRRPIFVSSTGSDQRGLKNARADLRRADACPAAA
ncbi:TPA: hypothetical protein ACPWFJ_004720 [Pseudomonas aeruginosa]